MHTFHAKKYNLSLHSKFLVDVKYKGGPDLGFSFNKRWRFYASRFKYDVNKGVCRYTMGLAIYIKKYIWQKKNYANSKIFHHAKIWSSKTPLKRNLKSFKII
jgi:hypothetical protein